MEWILIFLLGLIMGSVLTGIIIRQKWLAPQEQAYQKLEAQWRDTDRRRMEAEARLEAYTEQHNKEREQLREQFSDVARQALEQNNTAFLDLARQVLDKQVNQAGYQLENKKQSIQDMLKPLREALDKQEHLVKDLQQRNSQTHGSLRNYLESLAAAQKSLEKETGALVSALKQPAVRGRWGEIGLRRIVEHSGMNAYCDFQEQTAATDGQQGVRPDMTVHLPDEHQLIIDAKVPMQHYLEALETSDNERQQELLKKHARDVEEHMKRLAGKSYWSYFPESADFVVMYMEVESAFSAALTQNPQLVVQGIEKRVIFATPTTLITLLQTVAYTWRQFQATQSAKEIWEAAREFYDRSVMFAQNMQQIGQQLGKLTEQYNKTVGSWEKRLVPSLKKMQEKGIEGEAKQLKDIDEVEQKPKKL